MAKAVAVCVGGGIRHGRGPRPRNTCPLRGTYGPFHELIACIEKKTAIALSSARTMPINATICRLRRSCPCPGKTSARMPSTKPGAANTAGVRMTAARLYVPYPSTPACVPSANTPTIISDEAPAHSAQPAIQPALPGTGGRAGANCWPFRRRRPSGLNRGGACAGP